MNEALFPTHGKARAVLARWRHDYNHVRPHSALATIKRIEAVGSEITGTARTLVKIQKALEASGIRFIDEADGAGPAFA